MNDVVALWEQALREVVGLDDEEIEANLASLRQFCRNHRTEPAYLVTHWQEFPELTTRRDGRATGHRPLPAIESFLIHNGVNVFGDLVCVPKNADDLRQQWRPDRIAPSSVAEDQP